MYGVRCEFVTALAISQELLLEKIIIYTENLFPQHHPFTHLSKFNKGLKCFNFPSKQIVS